MYHVSHCSDFILIHAVERDSSINTANTSSTRSDFDPSSNLEDGETDSVDDDDSDGDDFDVEMETSTDDTEDDENFFGNSESVHDADENSEPM